MSKVAELIEALRAEAVEVDRGTFGLDESEARRRLSASRYHDRTLYLLPVVEGLIGLGAQRVSIRSEGADVIVEAWELRSRAVSDALPCLFATAFAGSDDTDTFALARLAVGVEMALGHEGISRLSIEAGAAEGTHAAVLEPDRDVQISKTVPMGPGVRLMFDRGWKHEVEIRLRATEPPELGALTWAVPHARTPITVNGARVSQSTPPLEHEIVREGAGYRLRAGLARRGRGGLYFLSQGVNAVRYELPVDRSRSSCIVIVELDRPQRDLSGIVPVQDERFQRAHEEADEVLSALRALCDEREVTPARDPDDTPMPTDGPPLSGFKRLLVLWVGLLFCWIAVWSMVNGYRSELDGGHGHAVRTIFIPSLVVWMACFAVFRGVHPPWNFRHPRAAFITATLITLGLAVLVLML